MKKLKNLKETVSPTGEIIYDSENGVSDVDNLSKAWIRRLGHALGSRRLG